MLTLLDLAGLGFVILAAVCLLLFTYIHQRTPFSFRKIPAFSNIQQSIRMLVEDGTRLHFSLGHGSMLAPDGASALAGLVLLRRLGEITSLGDRAPIATTGNGILNILAQDTLRAAHDAVLSDRSFEMNNARLTGFTPFSYAAGVIATIPTDNVSSNVVIGNFGPELALLMEAANAKNATVIAASDSLPAQAVLFASAPDTLIGEELFSAGAYAQAGSTHFASLLVQDFLRWLVIIALLAGAALKLVGLL